jgi:O-antigen/teichoic acid export membrane protein
LIASENQKRLLYINMFVAAFNIVWNIILIPKYSFIGSAYITVASQILLLIMLFFYSRDIYKFRFPVLYTIRVILVSLFIFMFWRFLINFKDLWVIWNILVYGWILWIIMWTYYFVELRKIIRGR